MSSKTVYSRLISDVKYKIDNNILEHGSMLPPENEMVRTYNISRTSVRKALDILENNSLISREPGRGTFVKGKWQVFQDNKLLNVYVNRKIQSSKQYNWYYDSMFNGVYEACARYNCRVMTPNLLDKKLDPRGHLDAGIFLEHSQAADSICQVYLKRNLPVAYLNKYVSNEKISCFYLDDQKETKKGIEYLLNLGHRKIGIIYCSDSLACVRRFAAYKECLDAYGIDCAGFSLEFKDFGKAMFQQVRNYIRNTDISAVFLTLAATIPCLNSVVSIEGINIPDDLSILLFDDIEDYSAYQLPPLTSIRVPLLNMGKAAGEHICKRLRHVDVDCVKKCFSSKLMIRQSTAKYKGK